jgi:hypothetical protein
MSDLNFKNTAIIDIDRYLELLEIEKRVEKGKIKISFSTYYRGEYLGHIESNMSKSIEFENADDLKEYITKEIKEQIDRVDSEIDIFKINYDDMVDENRKLKEELKSIKGESLIGLIKLWWSSIK